MLLLLLLLPLLLLMLMILLLLLLLWYLLMQSAWDLARGLGKISLPSVQTRSDWHKKLCLSAILLLLEEEEEEEEEVEHSVTSNVGNRRERKTGSMFLSILLRMILH